MSRRQEDWTCPRCNFLVFGSKTRCKCGYDKSTNTRLTPQRRVGDWNCPNCNFIVFSSKDKCGKCGSTREENSRTRVECTICYSVGTLLALRCGHVLCEGCQSAGNGKCPFCREDAVVVTRLFV